MVKLADVSGIEKPVLEHQASDEFILPTCAVGLELELEHVPRALHVRMPEELQKWWNLVPEGSLRNNGAEFVLRRPLFGKDLDNAITALTQEIEKWKAEDANYFQSSSRTSFHVHLDIRDLDTTEQLYSLLMHYLITERSLFQYFDDEREDNIFCLPFYRTWGAVYIFRHLLGEDPQLIRGRMMRDGGRYDHGLFKYSAFNAAPMFGQGSVEFRHAPALCTAKAIKEWVNIIMCLKKAAQDRPARNKDIGGELSINGIDFFYKEIFPNDLADKLVFESTQMDALQGVRLGQQVENAIFYEELDEERQRVNNLAQAFDGKAIINPNYL